MPPAILGKTMSKLDEKNYYENFDYSEYEINNIAHYMNPKDLEELQRIVGNVIENVKLSEYKDRLLAQDMFLRGLIVGFNEALKLHHQK